MNRRNILLIILVAITVFNVSAILTILYYNKSERTEKNVSIQLPDGHYARWFREQLNLDDDQFNVFRNANRNYHQKGGLILQQMEEIREKILNELAKPNSDQKILDHLSGEIGKMHIELKKLTNAYYLQMKEVCDKEQQEKLNIIFKKMLDEDGNASIPEYKVN